ncbi:MAG: DUF58 domain-containing protein [Actinomycetota bacterium]
MPTARGWLICSTGVALWIAGRAFGTGALEQLGFGLIALVVIAVFVVKMGKHDIAVSRGVSPDRVQAGREVIVTLTIKNEGKGSAPLLLLEDQIPPELAGRARFTLNGIESGGHRQTAYKLRPGRRGRYAIGPVAITISDPFGVARLSSVASDASTFLAYPRTETLALPRDSGKRRTTVVSARRQPTGARGEDFYTLREYVEGDDLRRIHWPATAKRNRYMIRQEETPWHARATILLDDVAGTYAGAGWERSVEVAASLSDLYHRSAYNFRLLCVGETGVEPGRGSDHFHRCLDLLATIRPADIDGSPGEDYDPLLLRLLEVEAQPNAHGVLALVTGDVTPVLAQALTRLARRFKMVMVVSLPAHRYSPRGADDAAEDRTMETTRILDRAGVKVVVLGSTEGLTEAWSALWSPATFSPARVYREGGELWDRKPELA